jgi:glycosyltransferase involved in cell wall biosynthesis
MRFSIITITFNAEKYLEETLASVDCQEFSDFEHIIWDGGSTDQTAAIVKKFPKVKFFQSKDQGISDAMNKGAFVAQGEFLIHLHADDLLAHKKVLTFVDTALRQHRTLWLYGKTTNVDEKGIKKEEGLFVPYNYKRLKKYNCISHPATFISREFFLENKGFNVNLKYAMDYELWLRLGQKSQPFAMPQVLAYFRQHTGSLSTTHPRLVAKEAFEIRNRYNSSFWAKYQSYRTYKRRLLTIK